MPRVLLLVGFLVLLIGGLYYLSTVPTEQPTQVVEVDVAPVANAG